MFLFILPSALAGPMPTPSPDAVQLGMIGALHLALAFLLLFLLLVLYTRHSARRRARKDLIDRAAPHFRSLP